MSASGVYLPVQGQLVAAALYNVKIGKGGDRICRTEPAMVPTSKKRLRFLIAGVRLVSVLVFLVDPRWWFRTHMLVRTY